MEEGNYAAPSWLTSALVAIGFGAGLVFGLLNGGFRSDIFDESQTSLALYSPPGESGASSDVKKEESLAEIGKGVYANCVPCHQSSGLGLPGQFPPLAGADLVKVGERRLIAILLKGLKGPIKVGDAAYNGLMPAWEKALSDKKIAAVASYIRSSWGNGAGEISEEKVASLRKELASISGEWTWDELEKIPADAPIEAAVSAGSAKTGPVTVDLDAGKAAYAACAACHQPNGQGLPNMFPPLVDSEYVKESAERLVAIVLKGVQGPITVNGKQYTNVMPAQEALLSDSKISQIVSYVRQSFGNGSSVVPVEVVSEVRKKLSSRSQPWTEAELKSFNLQ